MGELFNPLFHGTPHQGYEWCNECAWPHGDRREFRCGCGLEHPRFYRDAWIHWRGQHWRLSCAFNLMLTEREGG